MEHLYSTLCSFPPEVPAPDPAFFDKGVRQHLNRVSRLLKENVSDLVRFGPQLLELLNPAVHSISYLAVLHSLALPNVADSVDRLVLLDKLVRFLITFDHLQIRYAGSHMQDIMTAVGTGSLLPPSVAVPALATAILKLDPSGSMLTSSHVLLVKLAYNSNTIDDVLPVINKSIVFYPAMADRAMPEYLADPTLTPSSYISRETGLTSTLKSSAVLEYDLFSGLVYCAARDWSKAQAALERVITFPTREGGCSKIMVDAYKKWILVSILANGKLAVLPSHTGAAATRMFQTMGDTYTNFAALFSTSDAVGLRLDVEKNAETYQNDRNTGLVNEALAAYQKWSIIGLQQVYSKLSIAEIREQTKSAETGVSLARDEDVETLIQNMIMSGMLRGVIEKNDSGTAYLRFFANSGSHDIPPLSEKDFALQLATTAKQLKELGPVLQATRERLATNKDYVKHSAKESKRDKSGDDPMGGFSTSIEDEDLMEVSTG